VARESDSGGLDVDEDLGAVKELLVPGDERHLELLFA
jgi:hypothetical protein